jgi:hypothetical protein
MRKLTLITAEGSIRHLNLNKLEEETLNCKILLDDSWYISSSIGIYKNISAIIHKIPVINHKNALKNKKVMLYFKNLKKPYVVKNLSNKDIYIKYEPKTDDKIELKINGYDIKYREEDLLAVAVMDQLKLKSPSNTAFLSIEDLPYFIKLNSISDIETIELGKKGTSGIIKSLNNNMLYSKKIKSISTIYHDLINKGKDHLMLGFTDNKNIILENIHKHQFNFSLEEGLDVQHVKLNFKSNTDYFKFGNYNEKIEEISFLDEHELLLYKKTMIVNKSVFIKQI